MASYSYNGEGVRIGKTVNGTSTTYLQDQVGGLPHVLVETTNGQETLFVYGAGIAYEARPDGTRRYYHIDALGSTRVVTDDAGAVVSAFNYDAYGAVRHSAGEGRSFTYTGEQTDESLLVFLRARYFDPSTGRFIQRDAFAGESDVSQSLNKYAYTHGRPTVLTDPSGFYVVLDDIESSYTGTHPIGRGNAFDPAWEDRFIVKRFETRIAARPNRIDSLDLPSSAVDMIVTDIRKEANGDLTVVSWLGETRVMNDAPWPYGDLAKMLGGGRQNAVTLNHRLVIVYGRIDNPWSDPGERQWLFHEMGHVVQAYFSSLFGLTDERLYLESYGLCHAGSAIIYGDEAHKYNLMEVQANLLGGNPWDWGN